MREVLFDLFFHRKLKMNFMCGIHKSLARIPAVSRVFFPVGFNGGLCTLIFSHDYLSTARSISECRHNMKVAFPRYKYVVGKPCLSLSLSTDLRDCWVSKARISSACAGAGGLNGYKS